MFLKCEMISADAGGKGTTVQPLREEIVTAQRRCGSFWREVKPTVMWERRIGTNAVHVRIRASR